MYGKTYNIDGKPVLLSSMADNPLQDWANYFDSRYALNKNSEILPILFNFVEEIEHRKYIKTWRGMTLQQVISEMMRCGIEIPKPLQSKSGPSKAYDSTTKENFPPRKTSKEIAEENWQKVEARMLPEGDRDKITAEKYCFVDNITRRLIPGNLNPDIPNIFDTKRNRDCKKVRITIEVLED